MPVNEEKDREAYDLASLIRSAADIAEQAVRNENETSKKALQAAAKTLLQQALDRMDESVGAAVADMEEEDDE